MAVPNMFLHSNRKQQLFTHFPVCTFKKKKLAVCAFQQKTAVAHTFTCSCISTEKKVCSFICLFMHFYREQQLFKDLRTCLRTPTVVMNTITCLCSPTGKKKGSWAHVYMFAHFSEKQQLFAHLPVCALQMKTAVVHRFTCLHISQEHWLFTDLPVCTSEQKAAFSHEFIP